MSEIRTLTRVFLENFEKFPKNYEDGRIHIRDDGFYISYTRNCELRLYEDDSYFALKLPFPKAFFSESKKLKLSYEECEKWLNKNLQTTSEGPSKIRFSPLTMYNHLIRSDISWDNFHLEYDGSVWRYRIMFLKDNKYHELYDNMVDESSDDEEMKAWLKDFIEISRI